MKIKLIRLVDVLCINKEICQSVNQQSVCMSENKVESALGAAYYPGNYPFQYGGIPKVAGALCYFLIKAHAFMDGNKRTAVMVASILMDLNGWDLLYPLRSSSKRTALTEVIESAASSNISKDDLIEWFEQHKKLKTCK